MNKTIGSLLLTIVVCFTQCTSDLNPPSFLFIPSIDFSANVGQGTHDQRITNAWIYADGEYIGAFELPATIPVIKQGKVDIIVFPGINKNGSVTNPAIYSFFTRFEQQIEFKPHETDTIYPKVSYENDVLFSVVEDFEGRNIFKDIDGDEFTSLDFISGTQVFEGNQCAEIILTKDHNFLEVWHDLDRDFGANRQQVFLELNYKNDIPFAIGLIGRTSSGIVKNLINGLVYPKSEWNKIYFDYSQVVRESGSIAFKIGISAIYQADTTKAEQHIYIDNIKLLHR